MSPPALAGAALPWVIQCAGARPAAPAATAWCV
jgi:hypothetical protein